jgi:protein-S-isoprenylcysteine O-methyltransferase Ste14
VPKLRFPPFAYPILAVLACGLLRWAGFAPTSPVQVGVGFGVLAAGIAGMVWAVVSQVRADTSPNPYTAAVVLVMSGPYRWSRNPIYVGDLLVIVGAALVLTQAWAIFLAIPCFLGLRRVVVHFEEPHLTERFGATYIAYKARTRRWV